MPQQQSWYAHGKLLITGEYLVLQGARALAMPVNKGQFLHVTVSETEKEARLHWTARKPQGLWFQAEYAIPALRLLKTTDISLASKLENILSVARKLSPDFLTFRQNVHVETRLEFDTEFGLGSSSTLIANLAAWADIDAFTLQREALGGSGYDVACARVETPVFYQLKNGKPVIEAVPWDPLFKDKIFFVYLGQKQRSDESIARFKKQAHFTEKNIEEISAISEKLIKTNSLDNFESLLRRHEEIMSAVLGITPIQKKYFSNQPGVVKSLGAWGGDFVLVTSREEEEVFRKQMHKRGFSIIFSWDEMAIKK